MYLCSHFIIRQNKGCVSVLNFLQFISNCVRRLVIKIELTLNTDTKRLNVSKCAFMNYGTNHQMIFEQIITWNTLNAPFPLLLFYEKPYKTKQNIIRSPDMWFNIIQKSVKSIEIYNTTWNSCNFKFLILFSGLSRITIIIFHSLKS